MNEFEKIVEDVVSGALSPDEYLDFIRYLLRSARYGISANGIAALAVFAILVLSVVHFILG